MRLALLILIAITLTGPVFLATADDGAVSSPAEEILENVPAPVDGWPALIRSVKYPEEARKSEIEGTVLIRLTVGTDGKVARAEIETGVRDDLDQAAMRALREAQWTPAVKAGSPVEATVIVPVQFKLEEKKK